MTGPAVQLQNLGKRYLIGAHQQRGYRTLRESVSDCLAAPLRMLRAGRALGRTEEFWALRDVSFDINDGDVVGIIGRNGAGKSTLLKILSGITPPTSGRAVLSGRVGSLLEVGTGFHQELTGRENIYLNGSILGMRRREIDRKFDAIVDYSGVEKFLDTPVKRYSSGMRVRLAFAVAAFLEPEILIIDEVLAVGDMEFQKKCLGTMAEAASSGRTVLFVSHNMVAVQQLCTKGIWIDKGQVRQVGPISEVACSYLDTSKEAARTGQFTASSISGDDTAKFLSYEIKPCEDTPSGKPITNGDFMLSVKIAVTKPIDQPAFGVSFSNEMGTLLSCLNTVEQGVALPPIPHGIATIQIRVNKCQFLPGNYIASVWLMSPQGHMHAHAVDAIAFEIDQTPLYGTREIDHRWGCVYSDMQFSVASKGTPYELRSHAATSHLRRA